ncbi:MAG: hypothetical protein HY391_05880 [Deltaproteobacteria bacterium]|nr:hypothetical protein [Deltaproteobacteria bacterium]
MKQNDFRKKMKKGVYTTVEAHLVAYADDPKVVNLQLHQWKERGEILQLKRGVYAFTDASPEIAEIAKHLYFPCYFTLEYVLSQSGIIPEAVFTYTLVTPKTTRRWKTPFGTFSYRKIKREAFTGFDSKTLIAEKEKALVDYFYLNQSKIEPTHRFWEESRLNGEGINFEKALNFAKLFKSKKLTRLLRSFKDYAESH